MINYMSRIGSRLRENDRSVLCQTHVMLRTFFLLCLSTLLTACGFQLQGEMPLALPLHRMYLQAPDPYGRLARDLREYLKMSGVELASSPSNAKTILVILKDDNSQTLQSVSSTQQTRQYELKVNVTFEINDTQGRTLVNPQTLSESRTITIQSNLILGSSNETNLYYQQMRRLLAYAIMNRIASREVTKIITDAFSPHAAPKSIPKSVH
jgi:LPS-assembly lipoprotein